MKIAIPVLFFPKHRVALATRQLIEQDIENDANIAATIEEAREWCEQILAKAMRELIDDYNDGIAREHNNIETGFINVGNGNYKLGSDKVIINALEGKEHDAD